MKSPERARSDRRDASRAVLEYLRRKEYRPQTLKELLQRLDVPKADRPAVRRAIREMVEDGRVVRLAGRRLVAGGPEGATSGVLERRPDGRAVVVPLDGSREVVVPERHVGEARRGDTVAVRIIDRDRRRRPRAAVVEVLDRAGGAVLGLCLRSGRSWWVKPFEGDRPGVRVPPAFRLGATSGDVVAVEMLREGGRGGPPEAKVVEVLGPLGAPGVDERVVCRRHRLRTVFPSETIAAARRLPAAAPPEEMARRERFDDPAPVTIDGETAKDFDDAVAVEPLDGGRMRLAVHIADVAWFVRPGDPIDLEAYARGTSVYFPGTVLPMLPERLSNDLCSLRPGEDRLVQSVIMDVDARGDVRDFRIADGVIRSAARLTYGAVAEALEAPRGRSAIPRRILEMLRHMDRLRERLERRRQARGSVDFDLPEPEILLDVEGAMTGVTVRPRNRAHRMIEEFMLLANETVAGLLERRSMPCLYRVHEAPDPLKIEALAEFARKFGLTLDADPEEVAPGDIQRLLEAAEGRPEYAVLAQVALRSMRQARYSTENSGHFGLAATSYLHFTSPIRRYPDLVVHRVARELARRGGGRDGTAPAPLEEVAAACSTRERAAETAERELLNWKKIAFLRDRVGETFDGVVTGVTAFGLFVQLTESLVEGLLRIDRLGERERFEHVESRHELRARGSGEVFTLGDRVRVRLDRVDLALRRVDLALVARPDARGSKVRGGARRGSKARPARGRSRGRSRR